MKRVDDGGVRATRREARREEVLATAMRILLQDGLDALTVQRLAGELDCAVGALYRYFPGKASLLVALQERAIGELAGEVAAAVDQARLDAARAGVRDAATVALANLLAALGPVAASARTDPARHRLIDELLSAPAAVLPPEDLARVNVVLAPLLERVTALLHEAELAGALAAGRAEVRVRLLWAALHGLDHFRKRDRAEPPALRTDRLVPAMLETLLVGFGAPAALATSAVASFSKRLAK